jgi:hypothetical protein
VDQILEQGESLSEEEKAEFIDKWLIRMRPAEIDALWAAEIERRIDACEAEKIEVEPAEDVIKALREANNLDFCQYS